MSETMKASVHHSDWDGTAAASDTDGVAVRKYLEDRKLLSDDEFIVAIKLSVGEKIDGQLAEPFIQVLVLNTAGYESVEAVIRENETIILRKIDLDLSVLQFIGLFKRFSVALTVPGLGLEERDYVARN
jgi:hypothetical protein